MVSRVLDAADHALGGGQLATALAVLLLRYMNGAIAATQACSSTTAARRGRQVSARVVSVMGAGGFSKG